MKKFYFWTVCLLCAAMAYPSSAQRSIPEDVRQWVQSQRSALESLSTFTMDAEARHVVTTSNGSRTADMVLSVSGKPSDTPRRPEVYLFVLDGDTLDISQARRLQQSMSSIMSPELGPLLFGYIHPFGYLNRMETSASIREEMVDGRSLMRIEFIAFRDEIRRPGIRPPLSGRPSPGMRPPRGAPRNTPGNPGPDQLLNNDRERQGPQSIVLWFTEDMKQLVLSSSRIELPGKRALTTKTQYERISGIDIPSFRIIEGTFPMKRRLRTVTVELNNQTAYSNVVLN